jgi:regulator of PEP synthase PpsR (kinase-PPPase family)
MVLQKGNEVIFYLVSDSVGETAQKVLSATITQFPSVKVKEVKRFPFVESLEALKDILRAALDDQAILIITLVNQELVNTVTNFCEQTGLVYVDYMSELTSLIEMKTGVSPLRVPGTLHQMDKAYFSRVEAIEFAVKYDDGKDPRGFKEADFVLIGISRTSKTPLSMYLANKNYKVANLPLIPEVPIPKEIFEIPAQKIIGLTTGIDRLLEVRKTRLKAFGLKEESNYTDVTRVQEELAYANNIFKQLGVVPINVNNRAIEETAMLIEMEQSKIMEK